MASARYRAKVRHLECTIAVEWVEERLHLPCPRTGYVYELRHNSKNMRERVPNSPSLDKINPAGGYTPDNVEVVCWAYNALKQTFTSDEVLDLCRRVIETARSSSTSPVRPVVAQTPTPSIQIPMSFAMRVDTTKAETKEETQ